MLLDPVIENSYGPLINCDSYSTFDETSPFLASPSFATFNGEYQLTLLETWVLQLSFTIKIHLHATHAIANLCSCIRQVA